MRSRLSYANVMATIAVMLALGGTASAAGVLVTGSGVKDASLTGRDVRDRTLGGADVRDGSLLKRDFKAGQLPAGARGATGSTGPTGSTGAVGLTGPRGPSDVWQATNSFAPDIGTVSLNLPAGNYLVQGKMGAYNDVTPTTGTENPSCQLHVVPTDPTGTGYDSAVFAVPEGTETSVSLVSAFQFTDPQTVRLDCNGGTGLIFGRGVIVATEVATVH